MKTIKNKLFLATAILALASCADNTYLGDPQGPTGGGGAISFDMSTPALTRAERTGANAAQDLGYSFQVYATKTVTESTGDVTSNVFAQNLITNPDATNGHTPYWVWYKASTKDQTTSNSANWEYVGGIGDHGTDGSKVTLSKEQTIKYWDTNAKQYDFVALKAKAVGTTPAAASITNLTTTGFTVNGTAEQLAALYVADKKVITSTDYGKEVQFTFRRAAAKVRLGIYETILGYEVRNMKFYYTNSTEQSSTTNAYLTGSFNGTSSSASGSYTVSYDANGIATFTTSTTASTYFDFGTFDTDGNPATAILGTSSTSPTWATGTSNYSSVLPNTNHTAAMTLKVDYQLYNSTTGETINVTNATATVPAAYMEWKPNYAYTYLFKITDDKLTPITFDAVTIDDGEGNQQTITTVDNPSITTYQNGTDVTTTNEYAAGDIYVVVGDGIELTASNANLYTATIDEGYTGGITEASVANALKNGTMNNNTTPTTWTVTDASSNTLTISSAAGLTAFTEIPNTDSPTGVALTINGAKFSATASTTYVFEYIIPTYTQASGTYVANTKYYTDNTGATEVDTSGFTGTTDVSSYYVANYSTPASKHYKVIKVAAAS